MPSTSEVKSELVEVQTLNVGERYCELAAALRLAGSLQVISGRIALEAELHTLPIVTRVGKSIAKLFRARSIVSQLPPTSVRPGAPQFLLRVNEGETLARQLGIIDQRRRPIRGLPNRVTTGSQAELASALRGAFLARGSITAPSRNVSLEILCPSSEVAMALVGAAARLGVEAKSRDIRGQYRLLIRDTDEIAKFLGIIGAEKAKQEWVAARKARETRATANRLVNFDDANLRRSAQASVAACARVERAIEILGDAIPSHLRYAGELRLKYRDASLDELGGKAEPPLTKDAIAGRIRRLLAMADKEAAARGIPGTEANLPEAIAAAQNARA